MIIADTEPHGHGWRWLLLDLETGERLVTGQQIYWAETAALTVGERVMVAARDWPITDAT